MKILMVSLGCDKNLCDSEAMLGKLHSAGHEITNDEQEAEVVVINTVHIYNELVIPVLHQ